MKVRVNQRDWNATERQIARMSTFVFLKMKEKVFLFRLKFPRETFIAFRLEIKICYSSVKLTSKNLNIKHTKCSILKIS